MKKLVAVVLLSQTLGVAACARTPETPEHAKITPQSDTVPSIHRGSPEAARAETLPLAIVHKSASCGCCGLWVDHLRKAGFVVEVRNEDNLHPVKERMGVPYGKGSCHTAEINGYVVEGHVPMDDIKRLLREKPSARGLVLSGMPMGSPGMEVPDGRTEPYVVELVRQDGATVAFAAHGK